MAPVISLLDERGKPRLGIALEDEHGGRLTAAGFDARGHATMFDRRSPDRFSRIGDVVAPFVKARKKKAFIAALGAFGIYDRTDAEDLWRVARGGEPPTATVTPEDTLREAGRHTTPAAEAAR